MVLKGELWIEHRFAPESGAMRRETLTGLTTAEGPVGTLRHDQGEVVTKTTLVSGLRSLGIRLGDTVLVHTSMSKLGYVIGGAQTVVEALIHAVGQNGSIMMPAFSGDLSDPAEWRSPPLPQDWIADATAGLPPYEPAVTPTSRIGVVPEYFRSYPKVIRSEHPHSSFAAWGLRAQQLVGSHRYSFRFGNDSPLAALAQVDGKVLLLGAPYETASFVYLAQFLLGIGETIAKRSPVIDATNSRQPHWITYQDMAVRVDLIAPAVEHLVAAGIAKEGPTGLTTSLLFPCRKALTELLTWKWSGTGLNVAPSRSQTTLIF